MPDHEHPTEHAAPQRQVRPNVVHRLTGSWGSREAVRKEVAAAVPDADPDVNDKLVDALIRQGNASTNRITVLAVVAVVVVASIATAVVGGTFAFRGLGVEVGTAPAEAASASVPD